MHNRGKSVGQSVIWNYYLIKCLSSALWKCRYTAVCNLYINTLIVVAVWQHLLPGADTHAPLSMFIRLLVPMASDLPIGDVLNKHIGSYINLFTSFSSWRTQKETISELWPLSVRVTRSPDGVNVTPPSMSLFLYANFGGSLAAFPPRCRHPCASFYVPSPTCTSGL